MKSIHLIITGRVQGVGFREWLTHQANCFHLSGWVRNLGEDAVEALISGSAPAVEECERRCWQGPPFASVTEVVARDAAPPERPGFQRRVSVPRG